jgi:hypothetical protein
MAKIQTRFERQNIPLLASGRFHLMQNAIIHIQMQSLFHFKYIEAILVTK